MAQVASIPEVSTQNIRNRQFVTEPAVAVEDEIGAKFYLGGSSGLLVAAAVIAGVSLKGEGGPTDRIAGTLALCVVVFAIIAFVRWNSYMNGFSTPVMLQYGGSGGHTPSTEVRLCAAITVALAIVGVLLLLVGPGSKTSAAKVVAT
jgi:hypothetical protein